MLEKQYMIAPCGIYCNGICPIYIAERDNHSRLKEIIATQYNLTPADVRCDGCLSESPFAECQSCTVRDCVISKDIEGCYICDEFPCQVIEDMPDPAGKKAILRAVHLIRELGKDRFTEEIIKYYQCPHCGYQLFIGAGKCRNCKNPVDVD